MTVSSDPNSKIRNYEFTILCEARGESCALGSLSGSALFIFSFPPLSTPPPRVVRLDTPASCAPCDPSFPLGAKSILHRSVKSTLTRDRISKVFAMHLDYFSLHLFLIFFLRFFLFFFLLLELLIVYIHFFDIGEIENVGIYFSWKKEGKKKIWREV